MKELHTHPVQHLLICMKNDRSIALKWVLAYRLEASRETVRIDFFFPDSINEELSEGVRQSVNAETSLQ